MFVVDSIIAYLKFVRREHEQKTYDTYLGRLKSLIRRLGERECASLTVADIYAWLDEDVNGCGYKPDTIRAATNAFKQWQKFAVKRQHLSAPLLTEIEKPAGRMRDRIPTDEEVAAILGASPPATAAVFRALLATGARPNEIARARIEDWKRADNVIVLAKHKTAKKTGRPRLIGVGQAFREILEKAAGDRTSGPIFLNARGKPWTANSISHAFRRIRDKLGLPTDLCVYLFRHLFATRSCEEVGIYATSKLIGHTNVKMTERYAHSDVSKLAEWQDQVHHKKAG